MMAKAMDHLDAIVVGLDTLAQMTGRNVPDRVRADFIVRALELAGYVIVPEAEDQERDVSNKGAAIKPVKAWAICDRRGRIHVDKVMKSKAEAWGMLADELSSLQSSADLEAIGYRCVRVEIKPSG